MHRTPLRNSTQQINGVSDYVSHIFIMMSNVWQRLLMSAWRLL
jgi:hypothetical protein